MELYLDCNATTAVDPGVVEVMQPFWNGRMGNPSSAHRQGRIARQAVEQAREQVAGLLEVSASQVIFTESGTEANHLAVLGLAANYSQSGVIAIGATEHPSLRAAATQLERNGWQLIELPVDENGLLTVSAISQIEQQKPDIVSVMVANNETGVIQDLSAVVHAAQQVGAQVHADASQAAGKIALDFCSMGADCMTLSAHKLYGPKGVGALVIKENLSLQSQLGGGGQESGIRAGTENVPAIIGFGAASVIAAEQLLHDTGSVLQCRQALEHGLEQLIGVEVVAQRVERLPNTVMCLVEGIEGSTLLMQLDRHGIAVSSGSACQAGKTAPSPVLTAMGISEERARRALRISFCRDVTQQQVTHFLEVLRAVLERIGLSGATAWKAPRWLSENRSRNEGKLI
ncbi:MAG: cysteine desulfurase [Gammaproteobacteria bacterium]|nr:cysteine desulfurase [Gammaproteobacteria bacterium]